jgi:hypothetical protein
VRAVLDTSVLIATDVLALEGELAISAASLAELHFGVTVSDDDAVRAERLRRLTMLQRTFDVLPVAHQRRGLPGRPSFSRLVERDSVRPDIERFSRDDAARSSDDVPGIVSCFDPPTVIVDDAATAA